MGLSRRSLLAGLGALPVAGAVGFASASAAPVRLVLVVAQGGWDPTFTVDPKPDWRVGGPYPDLDPGDPDDRETIVRYGEIDVSSNPARR
ncbi:MAG: hypothetical protein R3F59_20135, partial [Myxococcota bacterium]